MPTVSSQAVLEAKYLRVPLWGGLLNRHGPQAGGPSLLWIAFVKATLRALAQERAYHPVALPM